MGVKLKVDRILGIERESDINFSWWNIPEYKIVTVPEFQQMTVFDTLNIIGELNLQGDLVIRN